MRDFPDNTEPVVLNGAHATLDGCDWNFHHDHVFCDNAHQEQHLLVPRLLNLVNALSLENRTQQHNH